MIKKLRSYLFYCLYAPLTIFFGLLSAPLLFLPKSWAAKIVVYWNASALFLLHRCCNLRYEIKGNKEKLISPCVVVSNHQSPWETLFLQWYFRPISAVLKKQLLYIPFFGWGLKMTQPIGIDRSNPIQAIKQIKSLGLERLKAGKNVLIFPEGTRVEAGQLGSYMRSAADVAKQAGVPLIPVAHNAGYYWLNKKLTKNSGVVQVVIGDPIDLRDKNTKAVMKEVQQWTQIQIDSMKG
ncbi:MAG: 1-acyl-sn-glycerol-3-phosphate acyltransferase [Cellvibrionaceae bacterium]|jgi:1-acyl-sn-glycerol-3-phosphate acyltransferase